MAGHLLRVESKKELSRWPSIGAIYEGFVASEIVTHQIAGGLTRQLYYFRATRKASKSTS